MSPRKLGGKTFTCGTISQGPIVAGSPLTERLKVASNNTHLPTPSVGRVEILSEFKQGQN